MLKNKTIIFSDSALNDSLKEQGWKERTELAASSRLSRGDNSESLAVNVEEDEPDIVLKVLN